MRKAFRRQSSNIENFLCPDFSEPKAGLDAAHSHDSLSIMKTATVADLRNNFATLSRWVHGGESIVITKRGIPFATVSPVKRRKKAAKSVDRLERLQKIFPEGPVKGDIREVIDIERGTT